MRAILLAVLLTAATTMAYSHSWYDAECCSEKDCHVIPVEDEPERVPGGWLLSDGVTVPDAKVKASHDGFFHRCDYYSHVLCLYVPMTF